MLDLASKYLEQDQQTYRQTARSGAVPIWYQTSPSPKRSLPALHHATIWQLLSWLGSQTVALQAGLSLLDQHDPGNDLHRFLGAVAPDKYRSQQRRDTLCIARRLLHLIDRWERTFSERFFPRFATRSGFS